MISNIPEMFDFFLKIINSGPEHWILLEAEKA